MTAAEASGQGPTRPPQVFRGTSWDFPRAAFKWTGLLAQEGNTCKSPEKWLKKRTGLGGHFTVGGTTGSFKWMIRCSYFVDQQA